MKYLLLLLISLPAFADTIAVARHEGITISLHDTECKSKGVKNLPYRAVWDETNGKKSIKVEGCYGVAGGQIVMMFFDDKTVAVLPTQLFQKATGI